MKKSLSPLLFRIISGSLSIFVLWMIWGSKYLPMVDLPQFCAQVFLVRHYFDPSLVDHQVYSLHLFSPYSFPVLIAASLALVMPVLAAVKVVISVFVLAFPLSMYFFLKKTEGDPFWSLSGFLLAFGFFFSWGFISYALSLPLAIFLIGWALSQEKRPPLGEIIGWSLSLALLYFFHLFSFLLVIGAVGIYSAFKIPWMRSRLPLVSFTGFLIFLLSVWGLLSFLDLSRYPFSWEIHLWDRIREIPSALVWQSYSRHAMLIGLVLLGAFCYGHREVQRSWAAWSLFLFSFLGCLFTPSAIGWSNFLDQRFIFFAFLGLLFSVKPSRIPAHVLDGRIVLVGAIFLGLLMVRQNFIRFNNEADGFDSVVEKIEPHKKVLGLVFDRTAAGTLMPFFLHFPAWAQSLKGGRVDYSFASYPHWPIEYGAEYSRERRMDLHVLLWKPTAFEWERDGSYDYFFIRSFTDRAAFLFGPHLNEVDLIEKSGPWQLYKRKKPIQ